METFNFRSTIDSKAVVAGSHQKTITIHKSAQDRAFTMLKCSKSVRETKPVNRNLDEGGEITSRPCNGISIHSDFGGCLEEERGNEAQWEESYHGFKAKVDELRNETSVLSREIKIHSDNCVQLKMENKLLLEELKNICGPDVIRDLEARNPDQSTQSLDGQDEQLSAESSECTYSDLRSDALY